MKFNSGTKSLVKSSYKQERQPKLSPLFHNILGRDKGCFLVLQCQMKPCSRAEANSEMEHISRDFKLNGENDG